MSLQEKINQDLKDALKGGDTLRVGVLRMLNAALHNRQIEKGKEVVLSEEDIVQVLTKEAKKRKESIEAFEKGGRADLTEKEKNELVLIESYLPEQMGKEEVVSVVERIISSLSDKTNFGIVMRDVMKELKGKADAKLISDIVKEIISR